MKQVVKKSGSLKCDAGGDAMMSSNAIYYFTTCSKLIKSGVFNILDLIDA